VGVGVGADSEPVLVERRVRRVFDCNGRCWQRVVLCRAVEPEEYDRLMARQAGGKSVQRALGDTRTGAQLLAEAAGDRRLTMARLRASSRGRGWLSDLAAEVRRRFGPTVQAARELVAGSPAVEAWARRRVDNPWPPDEAAEEEAAAAAAAAAEHGRVPGAGAGADSGSR
jgi:hypothetical protein